MCGNIPKIFILLTSFLLQKSDGFKHAECLLKFKNSTYQISISENIKDTNEWISDSKQSFYTSKMYSRKRRSVDTTSVMEMEVNRLKRKIGRLEKRLSESVEDLSKEVSRGFRRIEDKIRDIDTPSHSKRDVRYVPSHNSCPDDFYQIDVDKLQSCYLMSNFNTTWYEANEYCAALGGNLVALESIQEHYVLTYLIKNNQDYSKAEGWWTSGTFIDRTKQWMWSSDSGMNKPFTFIRWAPSQPDGVMSNCVYLRRDDDQLWNDEICTSKFNFVCETCLRCDRHNIYSNL